MIHHVDGAFHYAHIGPCRQFGETSATVDLCLLPRWEESQDGKCDWCRNADRGAK